MWGVFTKRGPPGMALVPPWINFEPKDLHLGKIGRRNIFMRIMDIGVVLKNLTVSDTGMEANIDSVLSYGFSIPYYHSILLVCHRKSSFNVTSTVIANQCEANF